jgi:peptide deformylase
MAIRNIRIEGDEILRKQSRSVDTVDDRIRMILDDMAETMYASYGLGLAGAQVGILRKLVVIDVGDGLVKLINPEIVSAEGEVLSREGCLSVPNLNGLIRRPEKVVVKALNENGEDLTIEAEGMYKKALCHEIDHLNGILFVDVADKVFDATEPFEGEYADDIEEPIEGSEEEPNGQTE